MDSFGYRASWSVAFFISHAALNYNRNYVTLIGEVTQLLFINYNKKTTGAGSLTSIADYNNITGFLISK